MDILTVVFTLFSVIGIIDLITGNHLKLGQEFERGIGIIATLIISMLGMLCLVPVICRVITPVLTPVCAFLHLDPSVIPSLFIANDMGAAPLAVQLALDEKMGLFNGLAVSSMMGVTVIFTLPTVLKIVEPKNVRDAMLGLLCGVSVIPVGCFVSGLIMGIPFLPLIIDLIPVIILSAVITFGFLKAPRVTVNIAKWLGKIILSLILVGLALGITEFLTGFTVIRGLSPAKDSFEILFKLAFLLSGAFPLIKTLSAVLKKPISAISKKVHINETSALGILMSLASSIPMFETIKDMDRKGVILNCAFSVSAAFALGDHLAFTVMFDRSCVTAVVVGKLVSGIASLIVAGFMYKRTQKDKEVV